MSLSAHYPVLLVVNLLLCSYMMPVLMRWKKRLCPVVALGSVAISFILAVALALKVNHEGPFHYYLGGWQAPWGIDFFVDHLAVFTLITLTGVGLTVFLYATGDILHELKPAVYGWYYTLYLLLLASMAGIAVSNDLFNLYISVEICSIASCAIISIKQNRECIEASFKYMILSGVGSGGMLLGIALLYMVTGNLNLDFIAAQLPGALSYYPRNVMAAMALFLAGLGVKAALFPLHTWLPDAHSAAPSPSSAILSGLVIKVYAVIFIKFFLKVMPGELYASVPVMDIVLLMASLGIIIGSLFAIAQKDIKRMLAYSSVAQIGYVFLGIGLMTYNGVVGGVLHIFNHAVMKSMLFLAAGAIIYSTGIRSIRDMKGIGKQMPLTMVVFSLGALSMIGIPFTNGFISKWYLAIGAVDAGRLIYVAVILISSLLNCMYYLPIVIDAFFGKRHGPPLETRKLPLQMTLPLAILGVATI
ncbi:MAG TPA: monovalent cation/H+ antiporter subunit D family protein, partial [Firmicutes bacterium]|nr:monovalent cation/H+ antiporter subunit D family protein [Bacillota bacterium]